MKLHRLAILLLALASPAQAQNNFTMPPPAGVVLIGAQVVAACGTGSLAATQGYVTINATGALCTSAGSSGGLSVTDQATWTQAVSSFTPGGGVFNDAATLSSGQQGTFRMTTKRAQIIDVDTTGNALYSAITASIPAGINTIGGTIPTVGTTGGATPSGVVAANSNNSTLILAGAHTIYGAQTANINATTAYWLKLYDKATAPTCGTDVPIKRILIPAANSGNNVSFGAVGVKVTLGLGYCIVVGIADNDNTSVPAATITASVDYN